MKKFNEFYESVMNQTSAKVDTHISLSRLPLRQSILKRLDILEPIDNAYHITKSSEIPNLKKIQNKKRTISCFTQGGYGITHSINRINTGFDVLIELSGEKVTGFDRDVTSRLEVANGAKWLDLSTCKFSTPLLKKVSAFLEQLNADMIDMAIELGGKGDEIFDDHMTIRDVNDGKVKAKLIKYYFDECEKMYKKYDLKKILSDFNHVKKSIDYNEILVQKIKIKNIFVVVDTDIPKNIDNYKKEIDFDGFVSRDDIANLRQGEEVNLL